MRQSFHFILKSNRVLFQYLWHALAILLVLVSSFGGLATPVEAQSLVQGQRTESNYPENTTGYIPPRFIHPTPRTMFQPVASSTGQFLVRSQSASQPSTMFIENVGQFDSKVLFQAQGGKGPITLANDAFWFSIQTPLESDATVATSSNSAGPEITPTPGPDNDNQLAKKDKKLKRTSLRLAFVGANQNSVVEGFNQLDTQVSYFIGNNPKNWHADVPAWGGVRYKNVLPGYDLEMTGVDGQWDWQFVQNEGSTNEQNPSQSQSGKAGNVRLRVDGAKSMRIEKEQLHIVTDLGELDLPLPKFLKANRTMKVAPQTSNDAWLDGNEIVLPYAADASAKTLPDTSQSGLNTSGFSDVSFPTSPFSLQAEGSLTSTSNSQNLLYSTYLGGTSDAGLSSVAVDPSGNAYLVGTAYVSEFPASFGAITTYSGSNADLGVYKLSPDGSQLLYLTIIGGNDTDCHWDCIIGVDANGYAYVAGATLSSDFPTTANAFDRTVSIPDAYLVKLSPNGTELLYSSIFGGDGYDFAHGIAVESPTAVYLTGMTTSENFPTSVGAYDPTFNGSQDAFVTKINPTLNGSASLVYSTFLGGSGSDQGHDITVLNGYAYITGQTLSTDFPLRNAYQSTQNGGYDAFVTKLNTNGSDIVYSTYLGGSDSDCEIGGDFRECTIAVDGKGAAYIAGITYSTDFPTYKAYQTVPEGTPNGYLTKLSPAGNQMIYSTYFGGQYGEEIYGLGVDSNGSAYVSGMTSSPNGDFPITADAFDNNTNGHDAFLLRFTPDGQKISYGTFLGGGGPESSYDLTVSQDNSVYVTGYTGSADFPLSGAPYDSALNGNDGFVTALKIPQDDPIADTVIADEATYSAGASADSNITDTNGGSGTPANSAAATGECPESSSEQSNGTVVGPINTRTGGLYYQTADISVPTSAGAMTFERTYSSLTTALYTKTLGFGWTHAFETKLIFPEDARGEPGYVLFKAHTANRYRFVINEDGSYTPAPGITGTLVKQGNGYKLTATTQVAYTFDENGLLTTWEDGKGHAWHYSYTNGQISRVSDDSGLRYLAFGYDADGRLTSVSDHTGRSISFGYDADGNLATETNVLGGVWQYRYDNNHRLTEAINPGGITVERTEYDTLGRAVRQWDGLGNKTAEITYNSDGSATILDANGNVKTQTYDERGTLTKDTNALGLSTNKQYDNNFRQTAIANGAGHKLQMKWDSSGNLLTKIDPAGNRTDNTYNALNNLTSTTDPSGFLTTYAYNGKLLASKTDALGATTSYTYTPDGLLATSTDAYGLTTSYTYNEFGQKISTTDPSGNTWHYSYDTLGRLTDTVDPQGRTSHTEYDATGRTVRSVRNYDPTRPQNDQDLWNIVTEYEYDTNGNQVAVTDTLSHITRYEYDADNHLVKTTDPVGNITTNIYDPSGRLVASSDALGHITHYEYDATGRLIRTINPLGQSGGTTTFDINNFSTTVTDPSGHTTTSYFDDLGRVIKVVDPLGKFSTTSYDKNGNVASTTDKLGRITNFEYDAVGRLIRTTDPLGGKTETLYDKGGRRLQTKDPLGHITTYTYDNLGRLVATTDAAGRVTQTEYDQFGRRSASIAPDGGRTEYTYDVLDRVIAVKNPAGQITRTTYNVLGNVVASIDASGHTTTTTYDVLGHPVTVTDPAGNTVSNTYDANGNLIEVKDGLRNVTSYTYDAINRRIATTDPLGHATRSTYDILGNLTDETDANGVVTHFEYDSMNRQVAVVRNYRPGSQPDAQTNVRTEYRYNEVGNRVSVRDAKGNVTTYSYDALNRVTGKTDPLGNTWRYTFDDAGNLTSITDANGAITKYAYDLANQLSVIDYPSPDADVTYTYNKRGQLVSMIDGLGKTTWEYDALGNLTRTTDPFGKTVQGAYDPSGNRTSLTYPNGSAVNYAYDSSNQLSSVALDASSTVEYAYDSANHVVGVTRPNGVNTTTQYDAAGRPSVIANSKAGSLLSQFEYSYDALGRPVQVNETLFNPGSATLLPSQIFGTDDNQAHDAQFFMVDPQTGKVSNLGQAQSRLGIEGLDINPKTGELYAISGQNGKVDGSLYKVNTQNGQATLIGSTGLKKITGASFRPSDNTFWVTGINLGLWTIDVSNPASVQQQAQFGQNLDALAWNKEGSLLYASSKKDLYSYDPQTKKLTQLCKNALPGQTDALEFGTQGLLGAVKNGNQTKIYIFDPAQCKVTNESLFTVPYGNVRSIAANATGGEAAGTQVRTITYTYDALNRILRASYSDGLDFQYTYDAAGNALTYTHTLSGGQPVTTSYNYDAANELLIAKDGDSATVWHYSYDHNGALKEMMPGTTAASGAKRYTYNAAGYLTQVEAYSGTNYQTQAQMAYDGRGQRLKMTAYAAGIGVSTQYTLDSSRPLVATSGDKDTIFYYGLGPIAETTNSRAWMLTDATNTPRQLTDAQGQVTLSGSFNPWGGLMEAQGTGNFTFGYFGGLMDAATGLMYVGNGQYYDPATGRFLTRGALPGNTNPYVPWNFNPTGALIGPLALLGMFYRRKKGKPSAMEPYLFILILAMVVWSVGMACGGESPSPAPAPDPAPSPTPEPPAPPASEPTVGPTTIDSGDTSSTVPPSVTPVYQESCPGCTPTPTPTPTPLAYSDAQWNGIVNVLWFEGASSFGGTLTEDVFRKQLWALRSEGKYDPSLQGWAYWQIVQGSRYSANAHFNDQNHPWPDSYISLTKQILSDQVTPTPSAYDSQAIYTISTTQFPRLAAKELNNGTSTDIPQRITSTKQGMPDACYNGKFCALPEIRWRKDVTTSSVDGVERGIDLPKDSYNLYYDTYHRNQYEECYWIGLYFTTWDAHQSLFDQSNNFTDPKYPPPNFDPNSQEANQLKCPSDLP